jgi:hypothetical protein
MNRNRAYELSIDFVRDTRAALCGVCRQILLPPRFGEQPHAPESAQVRAAGLDDWAGTFLTSGARVTGAMNPLLNTGVSLGLLLALACLLKWLRRRQER